MQKRGYSANQYDKWVRDFVQLKGCALLVHVSYHYEYAQDVSKKKSEEMGKKKRGEGVKKKSEGFYYEECSFHHQEVKRTHSGVHY